MSFDHTSMILPALRAEAPILQAPIALEGTDHSLATEVLPAPPPLSFVQLPTAKKQGDLKRPLPSYLPSKDPGSTYGGLIGSVAVAPGTDEKGRRKRARVDKTLPSSRAQRASIRLKEPIVVTNHQSTASSHSTSTTSNSGLADATTSHITSISDTNQPSIDQSISSSSLSSLPDHADQVQALGLTNMDTGNTVASSSSTHPLKDPHKTLHKKKTKGKEKDRSAEIDEDERDKMDSVIETAVFPNDDKCSACGATHANSTALSSFLYCDGCPRSFHLCCLDPPILKDDDVPSDKEWYCRLCILKKSPPPRPPRGAGIFGLLTHHLQLQLPKAFQLPEEIRTYFKDVNTGPHGVYQDSSEHRPGRATRQGFLEERDPYRLRDKNNKLVLCYQCHQSAALPVTEMPKEEPLSSRTRKGKQRDLTTRPSPYDASATSSGRPIISCDYCNQHWHFDCLNPPLVVMPSASRKWMCPNHVDHLLSKRRVPRVPARPIKIEAPGRRNNGNIEVIPEEDEWERIGRDGREVPFDEVWINGRSYRVPEKVITLDFWEKMAHGRRAAASTRYTASSQAFPSSDASMGYESSAPSSPLTSLSSLGDEDDDSASMDTRPNPLGHLLSAAVQIEQTSTPHYPSFGMSSSSHTWPHRDQDLERMFTLIQLALRDESSSPLLPNQALESPRKAPASSGSTTKAMLGPGSTPTSFKIKRTPQVNAQVALPAVLPLALLPPVIPPPPVPESKSNGSGSIPILKGSPAKASPLRRSLRRQASSGSSILSADSMEAIPTEETPTTPQPKKVNGVDPPMDALTAEEIEQLRSVRELMRVKGAEKMMEFLRQS